ncbi:MAG: UDP-N-acetylmuramate dehydrogenase, partial [Ktedonobacterales bacterium]
TLKSTLNMRLDAARMPTNDTNHTMAEELRRHFGRALRLNEPLTRHGTFAVGGPADAWINIEQERDLLQLVDVAIANHWPLVLVGNGTNVLYADAGARGIVARMATAQWSLKSLDSQHCLLTASAGVSLPKLVNALAERGLGGLEWGAGVPGTIGGAVVSNAGAHGACIADTLQSVRVLFVAGDVASAGRPVVRMLPLGELEFTYRNSRFRAHRQIGFDDGGKPVSARRELIEPAEMILEATFLLQRLDANELRARVHAYRQHRKETQPAQASAGSVFKNPPGDYSGRLIESAGLKGIARGKAEISAKHANFIINTGGASAADVVGLIALARGTVRERFGVELDLEVELRGEW